MTIGQLTTCRYHTEANPATQSLPRKVIMSERGLSLGAFTCGARVAETILLMRSGNLVLLSTATRTSSQVTFPIDFFEHNQQLTDVEFGGNDLLQVYNAQQIKHRLNSTGMYVANTKVRTASGWVQYLGRRTQNQCGLRTHLLECKYEVLTVTNP